MKLHKDFVNTDHTEVRYLSLYLISGIQEEAAGW